MEINHFSHDHPLFLSEEKQNKDFPCRVCGEPIFGISYCCMTCPYVLHKWCSELPRELSFHKSHLPDHPLFLTPEWPSGSSSLADCKICKKEIKTTGSAYTCIANECCSFNLHVECASCPRMINFDYIKTSTTLYFLRKYVENKKCLICGYNCSGPLLFSLSGIYVHVQCVMLPRIVKHRVHQHELTLRPPLKEEWYFEFFCDACETERDPNHHIYYCEPCEFVAHIGCGVAGLERPIHDILGTCPVYQISKCVKEEEEEEEEEEVSKIEELEEDDELSNRVEEEEEEDAEKVELFGHKHPFVLVNYTRPQKHRCGGCYLPIFGMAYFCKYCHLRHLHLHKWCAQLPKKIGRQMNQHFIIFKLISKTKGLSVEAEDNLSDEEPLEDYEDKAVGPLKDYEDKVLRCDACKIEIDFWDGFHYECKRSDIKLHVTCAMLPSNLNHPSHEHTLCHTYINKSSPKPPCQACGFPCSELFSLECESCGFYLHVHCFLLPPTAKHITHRHTLNLTYSYIEASWADEYYCDVCEKLRTPNCWVYCCPDPKCEIVAHVDCAVPKYFTTFEHQNQSTSSWEKKTQIIAQKCRKVSKNFKIRECMESTSNFQETSFEECKSKYDGE